ncbi:MAG: protein translocase subunit SecD [Xanthomonadales bacterium]|nr:protein translocase subunit SecD [Xanthomonadales bacterium]
MNQYPRWKYILIVVLLVLGALYATPNLFGDDPAVQVSHNKGFTLPAEIVDTVNSALSAADIFVKASESTSKRLLFRFNNTEDQLKASDTIKEQLGEQYVVALNLAPATPDWLRNLGAAPMVLGLDLQGGVHFLMQVDMKTAASQQLDRFVDDIRVTLRSAKIRYKSVRHDPQGILAELRSPEDRDKALAAISNDTSLSALLTKEISGGESYSLRITVPDAVVQELKQTALQQNIITLRNRVNELGVAEPVVQQQGADRIVVQLPGVQDTARAKQILGATATLEYRAVDESVNPITAAQTGRIPPTSRLYYDRDKQPVLLKKRLIVSGDQLTSAAAGFDQRSGSPAVTVHLDGVGAKRMLDFTRDNVGNGMAVVFIENKPGGIKTEEVISVATIREVFSSSFQTSGLDSIEYAGQLALLLRAGALAAPVEIIEERTVGPSLGQDNIDQGFNSVVIGFILVLIFMTIYYKVFGLIANVALFVNLIFIIAMLSLLGATLTLPGIAGIVLTVGMAVDANVLIFERIREELRNGTTPLAAIRGGYDKAFSTIADANITTLIAAIVLFAFGTGPIKGFAVTLSLGIISSMFTAIVLTRGLVNLIYGRKARVRKLSI